jgi:hypothetical protein
MRSRPCRSRRRATLLALLASACAASLAVVTPANARTYFVSGHQIITATTVSMRGGLIGSWTGTTTTFEQPVPTLPLLFRVTGTERFEGCLNRHGDASCRHDPKGTLAFYNDTWGQVSPPTEPNVYPSVWGACVHPITMGTGAFAGAEGVLTMIDTYAPGGVYLNTRYDGNIILPDQNAADAPQALSGSPAQADAAPQAQAAAAPQGGCGSR